MKTYRVLVKVTSVYALGIKAISPEDAKKVAQVSNYYTGEYRGIQPIVYEVLNDDFDSTN